MNWDRRGFTLVELIIVTVLGALLISATLQILITNQRTYTAQNAQIQGRQAMRGVLAVLSSELREISPAGGDLLAMNTDSLRIRVARSLGLICNDTTLGTTSFRVMKIGDWFAAGDSVHVFADNNGESMTDDDWITTRISSIDTTSACGSNDAQLVTFANSTLFSADSVSSGAEVRSFEHYSYGLMEDGGEYYLGRKSSGGSWSAIVGPVKAGGISFAYLDTLGSATTTDTLVAQIEITVLTGSDIVDSTGNPVSDSVTLRVYTRN